MTKKKSKRRDPFKCKKCGAELNSEEEVLTKLCLKCMVSDR